MSAEAWELVFMMFVLKLPIVYLVGVVWYAIRATPEPYEPAALVPASNEPRSPISRGPTDCPWHGTRRRQPVRPRRRVGTVAAR